MAARLLRSIPYGNAAAGAWETILPAVPAARAVVGRLVLTNNTGANITFSIFVGTGAAGSPGKIAVAVSLAVGAVVEQVVVAVAGQSVQVNTSAAANGLTGSFMGEEVDN